MRHDETLAAEMQRRGVSRRAFLKYASYVASLMALPPSAAEALAEGLAAARRQSVIWLSFQECTGCTESITRSHSPTLENLMFDFISLDYHHTLMAVSGEAAEQARLEAMAANKGKYIVVVDGSVPTKDGGVYSTIAGISNLQMLEDTLRDAFAVVAVGSCACFGGIPAAKPNPTGAVPISELSGGKPLINISGLSAHSRGDDRRAVLCAVVRQIAGAGPSGASEGLLRRDHPRPLLPASVLRTRPVRGRIRRPRRSAGLLPIQARLQRAGHL